MSISIYGQIQQLTGRINELETEKSALEKEILRLREQLDPKATDTERQKPPSVIAANEKIAIFANYFRGRADVFPRRWENAKTGKSGYVFPP